MIAKLDLTNKLEHMHAIFLILSLSLHFSMLTFQIKKKQEMAKLSWIVCVCVVNVRQTVNIWLVG